VVVLHGDVYKSIT